MAPLPAGTAVTGPDGTLGQLWEALGLSHGWTLVSNTDLARLQADNLKDSREQIASPSSSSFPSTGSQDRLPLGAGSRIRSF